MKRAIAIRSILAYLISMVVAIIALRWSILSILEGYHSSVLAFWLTFGISGAVVAAYGILTRRNLSELPAFVRALYGIVLIGVGIAGCAAAFIVYMFFAL